MPYAAIFAANPPTVLAVDAAVPIDEDATFQLTKGSAGAYSVAAPSDANIGRKLTFLNGSDFAHIVTFTGSTLQDGTTGLNITWTAAAFAGSSLTIRAVSATRWAVESMNLGAIA
jgi:hypothetical protein